MYVWIDALFVHIAHVLMLIETPVERLFNMKRQAIIVAIGPSFSRHLLHRRVWMVLKRTV